MTALRMSPWRCLTFADDRCLPAAPHRRPPCRIDDRRQSRRQAAQAEGLSRTKLYDISQQVQDAMWQPEYRHIVASER